MPTASDVARVDPGLEERIEDGQHVAGRDHDDTRFEIGNQRDLPFGHAARHGNDRAAQPFRPVMRAKPAGEQPVAIGDMHDIAFAPTGRADGPRDQIGPAVDIALGIAHHRGFARGARGGMQPHQLLARGGEHAEWIGVAQVGFDGEGEFRQIGERVQVIGMNTRRVKLGAVKRRPLIGVVQRPFQPLQLQRGNLIARGGLYRVQIARFGGQVFHALRLLAQMGALDAAAMAAKFGDDGAGVVSDAHIVNAGPAPAADLLRRGGQRVPRATGFRKLTAQCCATTRWL